MDQQQHDTAWRDGDKAHLTVQATYSDHAWIIGGHGALITDDSEHIVRVEPEDGSDDELTPDEEARISRQLAAETAAQILAGRSPFVRGTLVGHVDEVIRLAQYLRTGQAAEVAPTVAAEGEQSLSIGWGARIRATVTLLDEDPVPGVRLVFAPAFEGDEEPWVIHPGDQRRMPSDPDPRMGSDHLSDVVILNPGEPA